MADDFETMPSARVGDSLHGRPNDQHRRHQHGPYGNAPSHLRRSINDTASVLGLPADLVTPEIHGSISALMDEMERLRWEVERAQHHEQWLEEHADLDPVLPVGNRRLLQRRLEQLIARRADMPVDAALILLRVPMVGSVLSEQGLPAVDAAEHLIARELVAAIRPSDLVAHLATGVFAVLLTVTEASDAQARAKQFQSAVGSITVAVGAQVVALDAAVACRVLEQGMTGEQTLRAVDGDLRAVQP